MVNPKTSSTFAPRKGEVLEWLKRHAWKACIPQKGIRGFESPSLRKTLKINGGKTKTSPVNQGFTGLFYFVGGQAKDKKMPRLDKVVLLNRY